MAGMEKADVVVRGRADKFQQEIIAGAHRLTADEPADVGGSASGPGPYEYLLAALGTCTSMTIGLYARTRKWPLEDVLVSMRHGRIHARDCVECETKDGMLHRMELEIAFSGPLSAEQRAKLLEIAHKCPVHRTLKGEINIRISAAGTGENSASAETAP
jgi:putative redox protein